ncbi:hypothetical protein HK405_004154 [Cladochytrium tenue]|nr:hypothetical protein HK405_004154 [Cladochytrium tenue]
MLTPTARLTSVVVLAALFSAAPFAAADVCLDNLQSVADDFNGCASLQPDETSVPTCICGTTTLVADLQAAFDTCSSDVFLDGNPGSFIPDIPDLYSVCQTSATVIANTQGGTTTTATKTATTGGTKNAGSATGTTTKGSGAASTARAATAGAVLAVVAAAVFITFVA